MCSRKIDTYNGCDVLADGSFKVDRELTISTKTIELDINGNIEIHSKYKFKEKITFVNNVNEGRMAVCIGYNPARSSEKIDETNKRLCRALRKEYGGYYLFNLYPEVAPHKDGVDLSDKTNKNALTELKKEIKTIKPACVVLFFGRSAELNDEQSKFINELVQHYEVQVTTYNEEFIHPGSVGSIELTKYEQTYMKKREYFYIRIKS